MPNCIIQFPFYVHYWSYFGYTDARAKIGTVSGLFFNFLPTPCPNFIRGPRKTYSIGLSGRSWIHTAFLYACWRGLEQIDPSSKYSHARFVIYLRMVVVQLINRASCVLWRKKKCAKPQLSVGMPFLVSKFSSLALLKKETKYSDSDDHGTYISMACRFLPSSLRRLLFKDHIQSN